MKPRATYRLQLNPSFTFADAVATQMRSLEAFTTFDRFTNPPAEALAERISDLSPIGGRVFFTSSGSEAVETAIKLARLSFVLRGGRSAVSAQ